MGDLVNLRRARKDKARREREKDAQSNRVVFGRTKPERETAKAQQALDASRLDAHKLDRPEDGA
jgi:hypothetical protein